MPWDRNPATLVAGVAAGLVLAVATPSPKAGAEPATPPKPNPTNQTTGADAPVAPEPAAEPAASSSKIDAARVLENSASVLRAFPVLSAETPAALLEGTAAVLSAVGLAG